ncbi:MAG: hypothetical protein H0X30_00295 [Anaerolineae bacterium]|nr:hypothetical protein [Anaerolineae bacterium]
MSKIERLERTRWDKRPFILHASVAYQCAPQNHHFYMVNWWADEPAGFSRFEFTGAISMAYEIKITVKTVKVLRR